MSAAMRTTALLPTYPAPAATFVEGDGVWLVDAEGRRYLDFAAGIAVVSLGHRHPAPLAAAHAQLDRLWHASNLFATEPALALAARLSDRFASAAAGSAVYRPGDDGSAVVASSQGAQAFFCNSGAEAVESALKYARKATGKPGVIALERGFHGRTAGALAATGQPAKWAGFEPLLPGVRFARPNDAASLRAAAGDDVGLILVEPVLGEGGVIPLEPAFAAAAAELAAELGALLAFDEVQTGAGRTGSFFAWERLGVKPQLVTLAKGLANGLPIGVLLVADEAAGAFVPGDHGSTFGGNPVACAAACAVVDAVDEALLASVRENGARLADGLRGLPGVVEVRGAGLLVGAELATPAQPFVDAALAAGLVTLTSSANVLRLAPPLVVEAEHVDRALAILSEVLR
jgi:acetylornithine aminotransferase